MLHFLMCVLQMLKPQPCHEVSSSVSSYSNKRAILAFIKLTTLSPTDQVWTQQLVGHIEPDSFGLYLEDAND